MKRPLHLLLIAAGAFALAMSAAACDLFSSTPAATASPGSTATPAPSLSIFSAKYFPPTAANLAPACAVENPTPADQNACMLYKVQVFNCQLNLNAVGGIINGVVMLVPGYGPAISAGMAVVQPVINSVQLGICTANGFIVPSVPDVAPTPIPAAK